MNVTPIRKLVEKTRRCDPRELGRGSIVYIDISSIDRQTKRIAETQVIPVDEAPSRARKQVQACDVLVSTVRPNLNSVALVPREYHSEIASTGFCVLRAKKNEVDPTYLFYFTQTHGFVSRLTSLATGANYPAVSDDAVLDAEISLSPLPEQQRIAAILGRADRLRRLRRTARELSDTYLQSVFLEMFGDPVTNPTRCTVTTLGEVCSQIRDGVHKTPPYVSSGIPFITVKNIVTGRLDFQDTKFISKETHSELIRRVKPERGDILVSKDGTIGVPCVVDTDKDFSIFVSVALLRPRRKIVNSVFLAQQIRSDAVQRQIREGTKGIAIRHLHLEDFKKLEILLPSLMQQQEFVGIVHKFERLRAQQREAERQAEHLFQALLHRAFRGEV